MTLQKIIETCFENQNAVPEHQLAQALNDFLILLNKGDVRAAQPYDSGWQANAWVKMGILLCFRLGKNIRFDSAPPFSFIDKHNLPTRSFTPEERVRVVPGGSTVRHGAYVGPNVIIMPPAYINIGAYVGTGSLVDSHALVGSCAQVGCNVHLSAGAQLGGVLEPIGGVPVVVEDDAVIGGNAGVFEGTCIGRNAVIAAGVTLTRSTPVYDCVREEVYRGSAQSPLRIPDGAVVVPGSRPMQSEFAVQHGLHMQTPMIVKYRDASTDAATAMEDALR